MAENIKRLAADQAIKLLRKAYGIDYHAAAALHYSDAAIWWIQDGTIIGVETDTRGYVELDPEKIQEA